MAVVEDSEATVEATKACFCGDLICARLKTSATSCLSVAFLQRRCNSSCLPVPNYAQVDLFASQSGAISGWRGKVQSSTWGGREIGFVSLLGATRKKARKHKGAFAPLERGGGGRGLRIKHSDTYTDPLGCWGFGS